MHKTLWLTLLLGGSLAGCAQERSHELNKAQKDEARAERKVAVEENALRTQQGKERDQLDQQQLKDQVALEANQDEQLAKLDRKQEEQQATKDADHRELLATERGKLVRAATKMAETRVKAEADARERLDKIDARARELGAKTDRMTDDTKIRVREGWSRFAAKRREAVHAVEGLKQVADVQLAAWEDQVDQRCDQLDTTLSKIEKDLK